MLELEIQDACESGDIPSEARLRAWAEAALAGRRERAELVIRVVDEDESRTLNRDYRGKGRPTNVLSFPFEIPPFMPLDQVAEEIGYPIGDLVICAPVVAREAAEQGKAVEAHWAHLVVHGVLHLLGHDHLDEAEARVMEGLETSILTGLGYPDPYQDDEDS